MAELKGKKIALLIESLYNEHEFWYPKYRLLEAGAAVVAAGTEAGRTYESKIGFPAKSDIAFADLREDAFDGVVIPGGYAPDFMRRSEACCAFVRKMHEKGKLVAFICHAGWLPASAGILKGKKITSFSAIKDDMVNAGAVWQDAAVVRDGNLISSRKPDDLPEFMKAVIAFFG
ncbi:MAG: type 1 glutamine amidotransferase [Deltaproteobacteria bacterium]|jgi:protease I|nr:type 1 glutamine amidotransferase [Deltaproteobacteria bacterium]